MPPSKKEDTAPRILNAWQPSEWKLPDATALQALAQGKADEHQQKRALAWIVEICGTYDSTFRPGGLEASRESDFSQGKRFVGLQIVKLLNLNLSHWRK